MNLNRKLIHSNLSKQFYNLHIIFFLFLVFGFQSSMLQAQLIDNRYGNVFTDKPFFNFNTIKRHGIKSISGHFIHYKLGDRLRKTDYFRKYAFNREGQLIEQQDFTLLNYENDTSYNRYKYDIQGYVIEFVHTDRNGSYGYFYKYDENSRLIHLEYRRKYGKHETQYNQELGEESIVYSEKSTYKEYPKQLQQTVYNTHGIPYKDIFTYYNDDSLIVGVTERLRRTRETKITNYSYNKKNLIDTIRIRSNRQGVQEREYVFTYGDNKNLLKKEEFKEGQLITQYEVIYSDRTNLINDFLIQDVATNFIRDLYLDDYQYFER